MSNFIRPYDWHEYETCEYQYSTCDVKAEHIREKMAVLSTRNPWLSEYILKSSQKYNLDPLLVVALMYQESTFRTDALSSVGAIGPMQIMPFWADKLTLAVTDLYYPNINIDTGCYILRHYINKYGDVRKALRAYNSWNLRGSIYSIKVMLLYRRLKDDKP